MPYQDGVVFDAEDQAPGAALLLPLQKLLDVSDAAASTLNTLGIRNIFDLAGSPMFEVAEQIMLAARGASGVFGAMGVAPGEILSDNAPAAVADLAAAGVDALRMIGSASAEAVQRDLLVSTVADLGRWPPYRAAREILRAALGTGAGEGADDISKLVPRLGEFPTERRYYSTIVVDHVELQTTTDLATAGPIDIAPATSEEFGLSAPAVGARLTFMQSWVAHGLTLGNLLHSVALAPGESTRIAVLDWARQSSETGQEAFTEAESLTNGTSHNCAVSEILGGGSNRSAKRLLDDRRNVHHKAGRRRTRNQCRSSQLRCQRLGRKDVHPCIELLVVLQITQSRCVDDPAGGGRDATGCVVST